MLVEPGYMLEKPAGPSQSKLFLDQTMVPVLANTVGTIENALESLRRVTRRDPMLVIGLAAGAGALLFVLQARRRSPSRVPSRRHRAG